jgi:D-alanyl-D-alanine carboxypeptidase
VVIAAGILVAACAAPDRSAAPTALSTSGSSVTPTAPHPLAADLVRQVDDLARAALGHGITGAVVGIADPARGSLLSAYGTADTSGTPMQPGVHFRIASVAKTFTAQAIFDLASQGRLSLSDTLGEYVPAIPNGARITVADLLGMRGGVYDFDQDPDFLRRYRADPTLPGWSPDDALAIVRAHPEKAAPPDTATVYSNSEYILLGKILEKATGIPADRYLAGVFERIGLSQTTFPDTTAIPAPLTRGYLSAATSSDNGPFRDTTDSNPAVPWTAGAEISTVPDMMRYAPALATGSGLDAAIAGRRQAWTPLTSTGVRLQYGLGIMQVGDWVGHDGSIFGYSTMVFYLPRDRATVVVMVNAGDGVSVAAQALWGDIVKLIYPNTLPQW